MPFLFIYRLMHFNSSGYYTIPTKEVKAEIKTYPGIVEITISEWSTLFETLQTFFMLHTH